MHLLCFPPTTKNTRMTPGDNDTDDAAPEEAEISAAGESLAVESGEDLSPSQASQEDSLEEATSQTSQTLEESVDEAESVVGERRRSSLSVRTSCPHTK